MGLCFDVEAVAEPIEQPVSAPILTPSKKIPSFLDKQSGFSKNTAPAEKKVAATTSPYAASFLDKPQGFAGSNTSAVSSGASVGGVAVNAAGSSGEPAKVSPYASSFLSKPQGFQRGGDGEGEKKSTTASTVSPYASSFLSKPQGFKRESESDGSTTTAAPAGEKKTFVYSSYLNKPVGFQRDTKNDGDMGGGGGGGGEDEGSGMGVKGRASMYSSYLDKPQGLSGGKGSGSGSGSGSKNNNNNQESTRTFDYNDYKNSKNSKSVNLGAKESNDKIATLVALGIPRDIAVRCLQQNQNQADRAAEQALREMSGDFSPVGNTSTSYVALHEAVSFPRNPPNAVPISMTGSNLPASASKSRKSNKVTPAGTAASNYKHPTVAHMEERNKKCCVIS